MKQDCSGNHIERNMQTPETPEDKDKIAETKADINSVDKNTEYADTNSDSHKEYSSTQFDDDLYSVDDYDVDFDTSTGSIHQSGFSGGSNYRSPITDVSIPEIDIKELREEYSSFATASAVKSDDKIDSPSIPAKQDSTNGVDRLEESRDSSVEKPRVRVSSNMMSKKAEKSLVTADASSDIPAVHAVMKGGNEEVLEDGFNSVEPAPKGSLGNWLQEARKEGHMEIEEVANRLRISREAVDFIEHNDFDNVGAPVFVRGYIRNYAKLLSLPVEQVLEKYNATAVAPPKLKDPVASVKGTPEPRLINIPYTRIISLVLLLLPLYFAYQYLPWSQWFANMQTEELTGETDEVLLAPEDLPIIDSNALINSDESATTDEDSIAAERELAESELGDIVIEDLLDESNESGASGAENNIDSNAVVTDETLALALGESANASAADSSEGDLAASNVASELVAAASAAVDARVDINSFLEADVAQSGVGNVSDGLVDVPVPQVVPQVAEVAPTKPKPIAASSSANNGNAKRTQDGKVVKTFTEAELLGGATSKPTAVSGSKKLVFNFTGDCWAQVEEVDTGKKILARTLKAGQVRTITSSKKLKITLGNPSAVKLTVNGKRQATSTNGSGIARFVL